MRNIKILFTEADRARLQPLFEQLGAKGLRAQEAGDTLKTSEVVLAVLSENAYGDKALVDRVLGLIGAGAETVLPLQLDGAAMPDALKNALYARNIIFAAERDDKLIAERIVDALPKKKNRLPLILSVAAVAFVAIAGLLIWRAAQNRETAPAMSEDAISVLVSMGLTEEDLAAIVDVVIVGEQAEFYTTEDRRDGRLPEWNYFAYRDFDDDGSHWFSREDGHEYSLTRYEDLSFLALMPNLRYLNLARVDAGQLPALSSMPSLVELRLMDSMIPDLDWVRGSAIATIDLLNSTDSITDFSPLSDCEKLTNAHIDLVKTTTADMSGFAPPALEWLWINNGQDLRGGLDLSALSACTALREVELEHELPIVDLSFLSGASQMETLTLEELYQLRDISAVAGMARLKELHIYDSYNIANYTPVASCTELENFFWQTENTRIALDASFLRELPNLRHITIGNVNMADLDFLREDISRQNLVDLDLNGHFGDYSGLEAVKTFGCLNLDPTGDGTPLTQILPYLEGATVQELHLRNFSTVDLSALPRPSKSLELDRCGIADLSTMPADWPASNLVLNKCSALSSLDGLQNQSAVKDIYIHQCPRLTDWGALEGMSLGSLRIVGGYTLPDLGAVAVNTLRIESMEELADLEFLSGMDTAREHSFELIGLDGLHNLQPLSRFHGNHLTVSPQLADQAAELVEAGNFREFGIEYPTGGWEQDNAPLALLSLDELDTLPKALLARVDRVIVAGDRVVDAQRYDTVETWENGQPVAMLRDKETGEESAMGPGSIEDLSIFAKLSGLKELKLYNQPLSTLDGIQDLAGLEQFEAKWCPALSDASALFALQDLRRVYLFRCPVTSIQGVQNLTQLERLELNDTKISDLSPLALCDFSAAEEAGGFRLNISGAPCEELGALGSVARYAELGLNGLDAQAFVPALSDSAVFRLEAANVRFDDGLFARFVAEHPTLTELHISWNEGISDLTPLLSLKDLSFVKISRNMEAAIASLDGQSYGFTLEIEG